MAKLEFAVAIKLLKSGFDNGINSIKASLKSLQYQTIAMASALGAGGFAISNLVSKFKDVARETNRSLVALKNVTRSNEEYAEGLDFVRRTSEKYKQNINDLGVAYAKMRAAGDSVGMSLSDVNKIFESTTRSITAFGLGAGEANLTLMAVQQMMSKGKISSEELRRQLGERVPVAMEAMARAAGVTVGELDKLLKDGKLLSKDILPKFAEELEKLTPNVDTNNLETSITNIGNKLVEITKKFDLVGKFKALADGAVKALDIIQNHAGAVVTNIIAMFAGIKFSKMWGGLSGKKDELQNVADKNVADREKELSRAVEARASAERSLRKAKIDTEVVQKKQLALEKAIARQKDVETAAEVRLSKAVDARSRLESSSRARSNDLERASLNILRVKERNEKAIARATEARARAESNLVQAHLSRSKSIRTIEKSLSDAQLAVEVAKEEKINAVKQQTHVKSMGRWGVFRSTLSTGIKALGATAKSALASLGFTAIFMLVTNIVMRMYEWAKKQWEVSHAIENYKKGLNSVRYDQQLTEIAMLVTQLKTAKMTEEEKARVISDINQKYGLSLSLNRDINQQLREQLRLLELQAKMKYTQEKYEDAFNANQEILEDRGLTKEQYESKLNRFDEVSNQIRGFEGIPYMNLPNDSRNKLNALRDEKRSLTHELGGWTGSKINEYKSNKQVMEQAANDRAEASGTYTEEQKKIIRGNSDLTHDANMHKIKSRKGYYKSEEERRAAEDAEVDRYIQEKRSVYSDEELKNDKGYQNALKKQQRNAPSTEEPKEDKKKRKDKEEPLERVEREYAETLKELNNQKEVGVITEKKYQEELSRASVTASEGVAGILGKSAESNKTFIEARKHIIKEETEYEKVTKNNARTLAEVVERKRLGVISEEEANQEYLSAINRCIDALLSMEDFTDEARADVRGLVNAKKEFVKLPTREERDTTFDYKKSSADINKEELDILNKYIEWLREANKLGADAKDELNKMIAEAGSLEKALKLNEIKEDLDKLKDKLLDVTYSGIKSAASSVRHLTSAVKDLSKAFSDDDVDPFERMLIVLNSMMQLVDGIVGIVKAIKAIDSASKAVDAASNALNKISGGESKDNKTALIEANIGVAASEGVAALAAEAAAETQAAASKKITDARIQEMAATISAHNASLPGVGIATATAEIAAYMALIKGAGAVGGFTDGGLVSGGSLWGDNTLIRVNRGERVLNTEQQDWLDKLSKNMGENGVGRINVNVGGEFKLRGKDLYVAIQKEERRRAR